MFPVIDAETKKNNLRALRIIGATLMVFALVVWGVAQVFGPAVVLPLAILVSLPLVAGVVAVIIRTENK